METAPVKSGFPSVVCANNRRILRHLKISARQTLCRLLKLLKAAEVAFLPLPNRASQ
jgi:hypothetical protein